MEGLASARMQLRSLSIGLAAGILTLICAFWASSAQAYTYNSYQIDDLVVTQSDTSLGGTNNITMTFTLPDAMSTGMSTSGYFYINTPYLYSYTNGTYTSDSMDLTNATASSSQLTLSYSSSSSLTFTPTTALAAGSTVSITITGARNPQTLEGTGSFNVYGYDYSSTSDYYNSFWAYSSQVYGTVDATVTMYDSNGTTPVRDVSVSLSYYNSSDYSDYEYYYGYTNSSGQVQFAGLTSGRAYTISFYYSGTATNNDSPTAQTLTYSGSVLNQSYSFAQANVSTHFQDTNGAAINNAYWYFYKTNTTNYTTDYIWRYGTTDSTGLIIGAANLDGTYALYVQNPSNSNYESYTFTVSGGVVSGLSDPLRLSAPEVTGTLTAGGSAAANVSLTFHNADWSVYKTDTTDSAGAFDFSVNASGTYTLEVSSYGLPAGYYAPSASSLSVTDGTVMSALALELEGTTKTISGSVVTASGTAITDATVYAYQSSGTYRYASTTTNSSGQFSLPVTGGNWVVFLYQQSWPSTWVYTGDSINVSFASNNTTETSSVEFPVRVYNSHITGQVVYPDGTAVGENAVYVYGYGGENNRVYSYDYTDSSGNFDLNLTDGTFTLYFYFYDSSGSSSYSLPSVDPQTVVDGGTANLGTISLLEKNSHIQGRLTIRNTGEALANQYVYAYRQDGSWEWASAQTDSSGFYDLQVSGPNDWTVYTYASGLTTTSGQSILYSGGGLSVAVAENETVTGQDFIFDVADASITFTVEDADGTALTDEYGWVNLSNPDSSTSYGWSTVGCYLQSGTCSLNAASGVEYSVNYYSYSNWNWQTTSEAGYSYRYFTIDEVEQESLTADSGESTSVTLVMAENSATISGEFLDEDGNAVAVSAYVYASSDDNRWISAYVNNESAYTLHVAPGTWDVTYWIYGDWESSYQTSQEVTVADGENESLNFTALNPSATISGTILDPEGNPVTSPVFVKASTTYGTEHTNTEESYGLVEQTTYTDSSGAFSMSVPAGTYFLTSSSPDYLSPQPIQVTADSAGGAEQVQLAFVAPETTISGTVTDGVGITINAVRSSSVGDVVAEAYVYTYCVAGAYDATTTDSNGLYTLHVPDNDTCYVGAVNQANHQAQYSDQATMVIGAEAVTQNLNLIHSLDMPEPQTMKFDPQEAVVIELENGVRVEIPANAITAEDIDEVTVVVTPVVEMLHQPGLEPVNIGYELVAMNAAGDPISQFASDVKIVIPYNEEDLLEAGVEEADIQVNYIEDASGSWEAVEGGVIKNIDANQFEVSVKHFSNFAVVASRSVLQTDEDEEGDGEGDGEDGDGAVDDTPDEVESGVLKAPKRLRLKSQTPHALRVRWQAVDGAATYEVKVVNPKTNKLVKQVTTEKIHKEIKKLKVNKKYRVLVRSIGATDSTSGWSKKLVTRTAPLAPENLTLDQASSDAVSLHWDAVNNIDTYVVVIRQADGTLVSKIVVQDVQATIGGLSPATTYQVRVKARFQKGLTSVLSERLVFTTSAAN